MRIGRMRSRVTIQTPSDGSSRDAGGGIVNSWSELDVVWAHIRPLSGREVEMADAQEGVVTHQITIRNRTDVTTAHRILLGSRTFNIKSVWNPDQRSRQTTIRAEEGVAT